jgi:hypothetical protein
MHARTAALWRLGALVAVVSAVVVIAFFARLGSGDVVRHEVHPSYAEAYDNVDDSTRASDVVVLARGIKILETSEDKLSTGLVSTRFTFTVVQSFKGKIQVGTTLVVKQPGGAAGNMRTIVDGDPLMHETGTYLLFLKRVVGGPYDGDFFTLGGPSGRLAQDGLGKFHAEGEGILKVDGEATVSDLAPSLGG